jgi:hypothetical protein
VFILYVFTGLLSAIVSVVLIWPSTPVGAVALAPFFGSATVLVVAVTLLCVSPGRGKSGRDVRANSHLS